MSAPFAAIPLAPPDPIMGVTEAFNADPNPDKANLGVGVYQDDTGKVPLLACVRAAEARIGAALSPRGYLPMDGLVAYNDAVKTLVLGDDPELQARSLTVQCLGGTGALRVGAEFLSQSAGLTKVLISTPSWENHAALFARAGFEIGQYRYYTSDGVDVAGMLDDLRAAAPGTVALLHACCHNPTGCDLTASDWEQVIDVIEAGGLVPFLDLAYQGFSQGLVEDGAVVRQFARRGLSFVVANSFSKSFALYGERVGGLTIVTESPQEAKRLLSQVKAGVRALYSNPPTHGAQVVATVLGDPELRALWEDELTGMRERIKRMRARLAHGLAAAGVSRDMSFIERQVGMFSYTGLSVEQMRRLREEFSVYGTDAGRVCVAAVNERNVDRVVAAIAAVV